VSGWTGHDRIHGSQDRGGFEDAGTLVVEAYFAIVPE
jgi:hypothetical protein